LIDSPPFEAHEPPCVRGFTRRAAVALTALSVAQFLIALDYSIIYVALPEIGAGLRLPGGRLQWVVSGYALFFASFLVVGGRAADLAGPRRLFLGALCLFGAGSFAGGFAAGFWPLLAARATQGLGAAALTPAMLALIGAVFPTGPVRSRALAVWGAIGAAGLAAGVLVGGVLTDELSWRWVFFVNIPPAALAVALALKVLPAGGREGGSVRALNLIGTGLFTASVLCLVVALTQAGSAGWRSPSCAGCLAAFAVLAACWTLHERRSAHPLLPRGLLRTRSLIVGSGLSALYMASVGAEFFVITLFIQDERGYSPLRAGIAFLPLAVSVVLGNLATGRLAVALGVRPTLAAGFALGAIGLGLLALGADVRGYLPGVLPGLLVSGVGQGMAFAGIYIAGTKDVPESAHGTASAMLTTTQYTGGAIGLAALTLLLGQHPDETRFAHAYTLTAVLAATAAAVAATTPGGPAAPRRESAS
jgi:EmrB/QacA subfamily drug resistance transporter